MAFNLFRHIFSAAHLFRSSSGRRFTTLAIATFGGQLSVILISPLVAYLYGPAQYGAAMTILSIAGILAVFSCLRYEAAIPLCKENSDATQVVCLCLLLTIIVGLLLTAGAVILQHKSILQNTFNIKYHVWFIIPLVVFQGIYAALDGWALFRGDVRLLSISKLLQGASLSVGQVGFAYLSNRSASGLLLAFLVSQIISSAPIALQMLKVNKQDNAWIAMRHMVYLARKYYKFPAFELWARVTTNATDLLPQVLVAFSFGSAAAGHFGLAQRILAVPLRLLSVSSSQIYISEVVRFPLGSPHVPRIFLDTMARATILGTGYLLPILSLSGMIFEGLFGEAWKESERITQVLCILYIVLVPSRAIRYTAQYAGRQGSAFMLSLIGLVICFVSFWSGVALDIGLIWSTALYAVLGAIANIYWIIFSYRLVRNHKM